MKQRSFLTGMLLFAITCIHSSRIYAQTVKDFLNSPAVSVTYLGIDFSEAKLIGDPGAFAPDIKSRFYPSINQVVVNEPKKYELGKAFRKDNITNDLSMVEERNGKADADKIKSTNTADDSRFTPATISKMIGEYNFKGKKGFGILFIMESMNKTTERGSLYVNIIDMASGKILISERMVGKCGGFGFRNYWVKPVYEVLGEIENSKYKAWQEKYK